MKLAVEYTIKGTKYRLVINAEEPKVYEELDKMLKEICEKFNGEVERYRVSKIVEEFHVDKDSTTTNTPLHSSDEINFIIKAVFSRIPYVRLVTDSSSNSFSKEEKIIDVSYPCLTSSPP